VQSHSIRTYTAWLALRGGLKRGLKQLAENKGLPNDTGLGSRQSMLILRNPRLSFTGVDSGNLGTMHNKDHIDSPFPPETSCNVSSLDASYPSESATESVSMNQVVAAIRKMDSNLTQKIGALGTRLDNLENHMHHQDVANCLNSMSSSPIHVTTRLAL